MNWIGIYAALLSTALGIIRLLEYLHQRPQLSVRMHHQSELNITSHKLIVADVDIINRSKERNTITQFSAELLSPPKQKLEVVPPIISRTKSAHSAGYIEYLAGETIDEAEELYPGRHFTTDLSWGLPIEIAELHTQHLLLVFFAREAICSGEAKIRLEAIDMYDKTHRSKLIVRSRSHGTL